MEPPYHHDYLLNEQLYPEAGFLDNNNNSNIDPQVSPMGSRNVVSHSSGTLPRNDAPNSNTGESSPELMGLLKQLVQLNIDTKEKINEMNGALREMNGALREMKKAEEKTTKAFEEFIKKSQEYPKKHTLELPPRSRPYRSDPYMRSDVRSRMPYPPQNLGPYDPFPPQEQLWNNDGFY